MSHRTLSERGISAEEYQHCLIVEQHCRDNMEVALPTDCLLVVIDEERRVKEEALGLLKEFVVGDDWEDVDSQRVSYDETLDKARELLARERDGSRYDP